MKDKSEWRRTVNLGKRLSVRMPPFEHRFKMPDGSRWGDLKAASTNIGEVLTKAMRAVADANDELRGVFTVDWNQPAPDGSGKPLIANEVVHALIQHFDEHDLSNRSVPSDILGRAYEYLIKQFADDAGAKAGEFFTPPEVVDTLVRILEPHAGDTVYDPTSGSGGMLVHTADYLREHGHHPTSASYFAQTCKGPRLQMPGQLIQRRMPKCPQSYSSASGAYCAVLPGCGRRAATIATRFLNRTGDWRPS